MKLEINNRKSWKIHKCEEIKHNSPKEPMDKKDQKGNKKSS
jgi:hypothetical protein